MTIRPRFFIVLALSLILVSSLALAISSSLQLTSGPTPTAQVGVFYSSGLTASGGTPPYTFSLIGLLPPGLTLSNPTTGAITGTPNTPGVYTFTGVVTDNAGLPTEPNGSSTVTDNAAARRRTLAQSGTHAASVSSPGLSITVSFPTPPSPTPVPPSVWMAVTGLAGAGLFRLRQKRRA